ncbi:MAG: hypothetical protein Q4A20_12320 [Actinomyces sp.]|nr:hypothetical protein [Actinomyces sp.]MDO4901415.1 hypothetical protein [Actinomyces sp.]
MRKQWWIRSGVLDLAHAAVNDQLRTDHVGGVLGSEEDDRGGGLIDRVDVATGTMLVIRSMASCPPTKAANPSDMVGPGPAALTRMRRSRSSAVKVRASERTAALEALYTECPGSPLEPEMEDSRTTRAPSRRRGRALRTVK